MIHKQKESGGICFSCSQKIEAKESVHAKDYQCESSHHHDKNIRLLLCYLCVARSCPDCWENVTYKKQKKWIAEEEEEDEKEEQEEEVESQGEPEATEDKGNDNQGEDTE